MAWAAAAALWAAALLAVAPHGVAGECAAAACAASVVGFGSTCCCVEAADDAAGACSSHASSPLVFYEEYTGEDAGCFESTLSSRFDMTVNDLGNICYRFRCTSASELYIQLGTDWFPCPGSGLDIEPDSDATSLYGAVTCPSDIEAFCATQTIDPWPTVAAVAPARIDADGETTVIVTGSGFDSTVVAQMGTEEDGFSDCRFTLLDSESQLTCLTPTFANDAVVSVRVVDAIERSSVRTGAVTVVRDSQSDEYLLYDPALDNQSDLTGAAEQAALRAAADAWETLQNMEAWAIGMIFGAIFCCCGGYCYTCFLLLCAKPPNEKQTYLVRALTNAHLMPLRSRAHLPQPGAQQQPAKPFKPGSIHDSRLSSFASPTKSASKYVEPSRPPPPKKQASVAKAKPAPKPKPKAKDPEDSYVDPWDEEDDDLEIIRTDADLKW